MLSPSEFNNAVPKFTNGNYANNPVDPQYIEEPTLQDYNRGVEPLETLPAQWWNWLCNQFTSRFNKINTYVKNIFDEITQLLSLLNISPDGTESAITTGQLKNFFKELYPTYVSDKLELGTTYVPQTRTINGHALTGNITITKSDVGLGNVDNTSDVDKPVSTAQATAISTAIGALDVASVGGSGKYLSAISETDGKISATAGDIDSAVTANSNNLITSGGVASALLDKENFINMGELNKATLDDLLLYIYQIIDKSSMTGTGVWIGHSIFKFSTFWSGSEIEMLINLENDGYYRVLFVNDSIYYKERITTTADITDQVSANNMNAVTSNAVAGAINNLPVDRYNSILTGGELKLYHIGRTEGATIAQAYTNIYIRGGRVDNEYGCGFISIYGSNLIDGKLLLYMPNVNVIFTQRDNEIDMYIRLESYTGFTLEFAPYSRFNVNIQEVSQIEGNIIWNNAWKSIITTADITDQVSANNSAPVSSGTLYNFFGGNTDAKSWLSKAFGWAMGRYWNTCLMGPGPLLVSLNRTVYTIYNANNLWVAGSDHGIIWSEDGKIWDLANGTGLYTFKHIYYAKGMWVACSTGQSLWWSTDGKTWTQGDGVNTNYSFNHVHYAKNIWVACSESHGMYWSSNGKTWTQGTGSNTSYTFNDVYYGNNIWVAGSASYGLWWSSDGKAWTQGTGSNTNYTFNSVRYADYIWVAGSDSHGLWWSSDGKAWNSSYIASTTVTINYIYYANGMWQACGGDKMLYSSDGKNFKPDYNPFLANCRSVYYANGTWVAGTDKGLIWSIDGRSWQLGKGDESGKYSQCQFLCVYFARNYWLAGGIYDSANFVQGFWYSDFNLVELKD